MAYHVEAQDVYENHCRQRTLAPDEYRRLRNARIWAEMNNCVWLLLFLLLNLDHRDDNHINRHNEVIVRNRLSIHTLKLCETQLNHQQMGHEWNNAFRSIYQTNAPHAMYVECFNHWKWAISDTHIARIWTHHYDLNNRALTLDYI